MVVLNYQSGNDRFAQRWTAPAIRTWQQFADEVGGRYVPAIIPNLGIGRPLPRLGRVLAPIGCWTIEFDSNSLSESPISRVRTTLADLSALRFRIRRAGPWYYLGEMLGFRDIRIGEFMFDDAFVIRASAPPKVIDLLSDAGLRELIVAHEDIRLRLAPVPRRKAAPGPPLAELRFDTTGILDTVDRLRRVLRLFERMLSGLCRIGATRAERTGFPIE